MVGMLIVKIAYMSSKFKSVKFSDALLPTAFESSDLKSF